VSGEIFELELHFILLDPRPNIHSFKEYTKLPKITKIVNNEYEKFVTHPSYIFSKNASLIFDQVFYYAKPNSTQTINVQLNNTKNELYEFNITVFVRDCLQGEIMLNDTKLEKQVCYKCPFGEYS
jgi:hypothetical protein